jgi:hypothetical protein
MTLHAALIDSQGVVQFISISFMQIEHTKLANACLPKFYEQTKIVAYMMNYTW